MRITERIEASGHPKIRANHPTTLEITKEEHLTEKGDCIIGICASKGCRDLSPQFSELLKTDKTRVVVTIRAGNRIETILGRGSKELTLSHPKDLVARKSNYTCNRTIMIMADKAASDLDRQFVRNLHDPGTRIEIELVAEL